MLSVEVLLTKSNCEMHRQIKNCVVFLFDCSSTFVNWSPIKLAPSINWSQNNFKSVPSPSFSSSLAFSLTKRKFLMSNFMKIPLLTSFQMRQHLLAVGAVSEWASQSVIHNFRFASSVIPVSPVSCVSPVSHASHVRPVSPVSSVSHVSWSCSSLSSGLLFQQYQ